MKRVNPYSDTPQPNFKKVHFSEKDLEDLPREITENFFSSVPSKSVGRSALVCKSWKKVIDNSALLSLKRSGSFFGKKDWEKQIGDVGTEPSLPNNIQQILNAPCPFWPNKKVRETHLLVLVPETVNGTPFHLNALEMLIQNPKTGHKKKYNYYDNNVKKELGSQSQPSHWILMTNDVIPNSRSKTYDDQKKLIATHAKESGKPYILPTALEAATVILMHYVEARKYTYTDNKKGSEWTYTLCQEKVNKNQWPAAIGSFSSEGLDVDYYCDSPDLYGVASLRKF